MLSFISYYMYSRISSQKLPIFPDKEWFWAFTIHKNQSSEDLFACEWDQISWKKSD